MEKNYGSHIDFPSDWKSIKLGDIVNFKNGHNSDKESYGSGIKFINVMDVINSSSIDYENIQGVVNINEMNKSNYIVEYGDVLFNRTSEVAEQIALSSIYLNHQEVVFGGFVIRGRFIDNSIDNLYKKYLFRSQAFRKEVVKYAQGGIRSNIGQSDLAKVQLFIPNFEEQKAIANCLSIWDEAIEKQQKLIESKEVRHKALMQKLLSGKKRLPGFADEWKEVKLGDLFSERNETRYDDLPLLSIGQEGVYPQTDSNKRDISNGDKSKYKRIIPGDIGYNTMRMWQGRSALSSLEGIVSPAYTILTPKENVDSYFFSLLFKTTRLTNLFWRNSQGLVDDTLNCKYKDFSIIKCNVPSYKEQIAITEILKISEKEIEIEKQKVNQLKEQKKALMQKLLTGKVRLPLNN